MTDKELRKLSRAELLEMLLAQTIEVDNLKAQVLKLTEKVEKKDIIISNAGSIAEASLMLNGVFEAAQNAADQFLQNVAGADLDFATPAANTETPESLLNDARIRCAQMVKETEEQCDKMLKEAKKQTRECWVEVSKKVEMLMNENPALCKKIYSSEDTDL